MNNGSDPAPYLISRCNWLMGNWGGNQNVMHNNNWLLAPPGPTPDNLPHMYAVTSVGATTTSMIFQLFWRPEQVVLLLSVVFN
jgi:hypothetical protein